MAKPAPWIHLRGLREIRRAREMSQAALAECTNLTRNYIMAVERGMTISDVTHLDVLAAALDVSPRRLQRRQHAPRPAKGTNAKAQV